jgi:hypothetical protein
MTPFLSLIALCDLIRTDELSQNRWHIVNRLRTVVWTTPAVAGPRRLFARQASSFVALGYAVIASGRPAHSARGPCQAGGVSTLVRLRRYAAKRGNRLGLLLV